MNFTAKDVAELRAKTGCGMMDCKKALNDANGNMDEAVEILRKKGLAAQEKKASRVAAEGVAYAKVEGKVGVVIEVNAETDFVAKNDMFKAFVEACADVVIAQNPADVDALLACTAADGETIDAKLKEAILVIGENIKVRRFERVEGDCAAYVHAGGTIGVLVKFDADENASGSEVIASCGKDVAMQVAAMNPTYLDEASVPADALEKEKEIQLAIMAADPKMANKPQAVLEKIVAGKLGKFYENNCLVDMAFVKDGSLTVKKYVDECAKSVNGTMKVSQFVRFEKGEGLEKRQDNFAEEIANMVK
ncbi:MAG: translation elongation factor Ts [Clostridia bacterium]|nr:translation elongation factor Ts [Clostridia bacterium]